MIQRIVSPLQGGVKVVIPDLRLHLRSSGSHHPNGRVKEGLFCVYPFSYWDWVNSRDKSGSTFSDNLQSETH